MQSFTIHYRPRASAVGEKLWSAAQQTTSASKAAPRLDNHRCRMLRHANVNLFIALAGYPFVFVDVAFQLNHLPQATVLRNIYLQCPEASTYITIIYS